MRNFSYIILFFTFFVSWNTEHLNNENILTNRPDEIIPILEQFIRDATSNGVYDVNSYLAQNLDKIQVVHHGSDLLNKGNKGYLIFDSKTEEPIGRLIHYRVETGLLGGYLYRTEIYLSNKLLKHRYALRHVLYHELGHMTGVPHNSKEFYSENKFYIMNEYFPLWYIEKGYQIPEEKWKQYSHLLFSKIRNTKIKQLWLYRYYNDK